MIRYLDFLRWFAKCGGSGGITLRWVVWMWAIGPIPGFTCGGGVGITGGFICDWLWIALKFAFKCCGGGGGTVTAIGTVCVAPDVWQTFHLNVYTFEYFSHWLPEYPPKAL
jgi:hypothetical protein